MTRAYAVLRSLLLALTLIVEVKIRLLQVVLRVRTCYNCRMNEHAGEDAIGIDRDSESKPLPIRIQ